MRRVHTQAKKANRGCPPPHWNICYNAPVWLRRQHHILGADHIRFDIEHGLMGGSAAAVVPETNVVQPVQKPKSIWRRFLDFIHRIFHRSED